MSSPANPSAPPREPSSPPRRSQEDAPHQSEEKVESEEPGDDGASKPDADGSAAQLSGSDDAPPLANEPVPDEPPLPNEPLPGGPPLPQEPPPQAEDDGWDFQWDPNTQAWFFYNRFTGKTQWDNPRVPSGAVPAAPGTVPSGSQPPASEPPAAGGYNPAIHGDYDPNAWYAQGDKEEEDPDPAAAAATAVGDPYTSTATFNRFTGQFQTDDMGPGRHTDDAKSRRQMNAFFDVDSAANAHDGRSLKAERSNKKPSKTELKAFKEKRRARKEEKRRAWLRD